MKVRKRPQSKLAKAQLVPVAPAYLARPLLTARPTPIVNSMMLAEANVSSSAAMIMTRRRCRNLKKQYSCRKLLRPFESYFIDLMMNCYPLIVYHLGQ